MQKAIGSSQYLKLINWLKRAREDQGLSMRDLGTRLQEPHSFVQKVESLERRLDVYEYSQYCDALGLDPRDGVSLMRK